jgi:hypothetical protein
VYSGIEISLFTERKTFIIPIISNSLTEESIHDDKHSTYSQ